MHKHAGDQVLQRQEPAWLAADRWPGGGETGTCRGSCLACQVLRVVQATWDEGGRGSFTLWAFWLW